MNPLDYLVLFGSILAIAVYGILRTRGRRNLHDYLRGKRQSWFAIGLSVMATQASAITFLSTPGQGYADGMSFVQNYFALPLALVIIAAFFLPIYRKLNVYTAYEYLSTRFDKKTRLLAAALFLLQRALAAGYTLYAPAIVLSTVFGWSLSLTILLSGITVIVYTAVGGSDAVTHTQKYQIAIIFAGMIAAFVILLHKIPCSFTDALTLAGHFGKTNAVDFSLNPRKTYTVWTGMLGGIFLMLSYFGTDQSQVQRYISGDHLRESRLGLMFNALFKIPMQFFVLLLGVMLFVFYLFHPAPVFFNRTVWQEHAQKSPEMTRIAASYTENETLKGRMVLNWLDARRADDAGKAQAALGDIDRLDAHDQAIRTQAKDTLQNANARVSTSDSDYVFITFILDNIPHGLIGLLVACFFLAALGAKAAELNALASCSTIDFYRYLIHPPVSPPAAPPMNNEQSPMNNPSDRHYVRASKAFTILWGLISLSFALFLFSHFAENLIQATNIVGSLFYGVVLAIFLIGFFLKFITGTPTFIAALIAQSLVFTFALLNYFNILDISYLWYNLIGVAACIILAIILQPLFPPARQPQGFPITANTPPDSAV